jgi:hypothetical protein
MLRIPHCLDNRLTDGEHGYGDNITFYFLLYTPSEPFRFYETTPSKVAYYTHNAEEGCKEAILTASYDFVEPFL